jgi:hypothetical protein
MPEILLRVNTAGDPADAHRAVATLDGIRGWWSNHVEGEDGVGGGFKVAFPEAPITFDFRVTEDAPGCVAWRCLAGPPEWVGADLTFDVTAGDDGGGASVLFTHGGWESTADPFPFIAYSWAQILARLQAYVETSRPSPFFDF